MSRTILPIRIELPEAPPAFLAAGLRERKGRQFAHRLEVAQRLQVALPEAAGLGEGEMHPLVADSVDGNGADGLFHGDHLLFRYGAPECDDEYRGVFGKQAMARPELYLSDASTVVHLALQASRLIHRGTLKA
jgi:hypothetical protein